MDGLALTAEFPLAPARERDTDAALVRRAVEGDAGAFEALYRRHVGRVHGAILRLVGRDRARAEELTQDAFVQAWRKLGSFRFESAFATWLHRLGVNIALMDLRIRRDEDAMGDDDLRVAAGGEVPFCAAERGDLERAVAALPTRARAVLVLHDVEGFKHEEIATELGMAVGSSKAQLHRARGLLRRALGEHA
ncbi:MAG: sigma-70 family RNA polymerase sigma factor [Proteobacteria bacterium]|nr:sigma-70 family RNA polymerase sigma factor [Pseudomonadota bacterium]